MLEQLKKEESPPISIGRELKLESIQKLWEKMEKILEKKIEGKFEAVY